MGRISIPDGSARTDMWHSVLAKTLSSTHLLLHVAIHGTLAENKKRVKKDKASAKRSKQRRIGLKEKCWRFSEKESLVMLPSDLAEFRLSIV